MLLWRKGLDLQMVMYHAVIKTKESNLGGAPYAVWGEATPYAIAALCDAARSSRRENTDSVVREPERMGRQLTTQGIRLRVL